MRIDSKLVEQKYSEGLESILDLFTQVSIKIKILEDDQRKLKKAFFKRPRKTGLTLMVAF